MSPIAWALLITLVIGIALVLGLVLLQGRRPAKRPRPGGRSTPSAVSPPEVEAPWLVLLEGPESGRRFRVTGGEFTIGRGVGNRLPLSGRFVSRHHALIIFQNGQYILYDRDSTNGTYVNGRLVVKYILRPGDRIQIGPSILEFQSPRILPRISPTPIPSPTRIPSPSFSLPIPRFQDYVITPLKQGGAATIYKGVRRDGQQTVAIKVLHNTDHELQRRFAYEARNMKALNHPHIAQAYDSGRFNGVFYLVMEYCDGGSLRDRLVGSRPLSMDFVALVIGQTCEALDYAHRHGVIHRDIKPENIMFTTRNGVKVVDFGIAKWTGQTTQTVDGMVIGTPLYLSYEQARGLPVDQRSDIYSLGVVLYEMVTGRAPFQGQALEVIRKHLTEPPPPPRRFNPNLPPEIETAVLRALHKDRRQRFQSAPELAAAVSYRGKPSISQESREQPLSFWTSAKPLPVLIITSGSRRGQRIPLAPASTVLGRQSVNPGDVQISRRHAQVVIQGNAVWLEDLNSANGTYHNDRRIFGRVLLKGGDAIQIGNTILRFEA
jgi:serine/threonine protein kinase